MVLFRQLYDNETSTYTYLIAAGYGREAVLIDPVKHHVEQYITLLQELELTLVVAMDTHLHADHITGLGELKRSLNCQIMMGYPSKAECLSNVFHDNDVLQVDGVELKVVYTPGHTDNSYCFLMCDRVFTGDTLLIRGTGRTDFQNGDPIAQYESLFNRLLTLPEETLVYPGHDYNGMTVSTIKEEKKYNPRLQVQSVDEYVKLMNGLNLPHPKMMHIAVPANQKCGMVEET